MILEIACFSREAAEMAFFAGADRIEFCHDYSSGGLTPDPMEVKLLKQIAPIPVFVMIRPRPGNFVYSRKELLQMHLSIEVMKSAGADGFVFGVVNREYEITVKECIGLVETAYPMPCTLHRVFDGVPDKTRSVHLAIECGFSRILTSGGPGNAVDNLETIKNLIIEVKGQIIIIPGGGLRSTNLKIIKTHCGAIEYHSAALTDKDTLFPDDLEIKTLKTILS